MTKKKAGKVKNNRKQLIANNNISLSFEYYDGEKYCISQMCDTKKGHANPNVQKIRNDLKSFLSGLAYFCSLGYNEHSQNTHFHPLDNNFWSKSEVKTGFPNSKMKESVAQFQCDMKSMSNLPTRMYGYLHSSVFYVVWIDIYHSVYRGSYK